MHADDAKWNYKRFFHDSVQQCKTWLSSIAPAAEAHRTSDERASSYESSSSSSRSSSRSSGSSSRSNSSGGNNSTSSSTKDDEKHGASRESTGKEEEQRQSSPINQSISESHAEAAGEGSADLKRTTKQMVEHDNVGEDNQKENDNEEEENEKEEEKNEDDEEEEEEEKVDKNDYFIIKFEEHFHFNTIREMHKMLQINFLVNKDWF